MDIRLRWISVPDIHNLVTGAMAVLLKEEVHKSMLKIDITSFSVRYS